MHWNCIRDLNRLLGSVSFYKPLVSSSSDSLHMSAFYFYAASMPLLYKFTDIYQAPII